MRVEISDPFEFEPGTSPTDAISRKVHLDVDIDEKGAIQRIRILDAGIEAEFAPDDLSTFPEQFKSYWESLEGDEGFRKRAQWHYVRFRCKADHLYAGTFLGMDFQFDPHKMLFAQFLQKKPGQNIVLSDLDIHTKKRMILWPRGLFKTSSVIVEIIQLVWNYPNIRILFLTGGDTLAKRQLDRVKRFFEKPSKQFRTYFPDFCTKSVLNKKSMKYEDVVPKMGNQHEFTVPCRTNDIFAEPTFAISTAKSVKAGSHYDVIFIDDLVNETNYRSVKLLEKVYEDYKGICPLLEPSGFMFVTGTRYSFGDTYERIQESAKEEEKEIGKTIWKFSIEDCWAEHCINCGCSEAFHNKDVNFAEPPCMVHPHCRGFKSDGVRGVLFPMARTRDGRQIGHSVEFLEGEKIRLHAEFFANQYENNPIAEGSQTFTDELIGAQTLFHEEQLPTFAQSYTFIVGDLAYVGQEGRDSSVLYVCRLFQGQIFVVDCFAGNWDSGAVAENVVAAIMKHRPNLVYLERFNGWEAYNTVIEAYAKSLGIPSLPIVWIKGSQAPNAKMARIGSAKGPLKNRRLWLFAGMKDYKILTTQLTKWPKLGKHDDYADCLGMVVAAPTGFQTESTPIPPSVTNWLRKLHQAQPVEDDYTDNGCGSGIVC